MIDVTPNIPVSYDATFHLELLAARERGLNPRAACFEARLAAAAAVDGQRPQMTDQRGNLSQLAAAGCGFSARG